MTLLSCGILILPPGAHSSKILVENFAIDPIPFSDNYFDGVSAFDLGVFGGKIHKYLSSGKKDEKGHPNGHHNHRCDF